MASSKSRLVIGYVSAFGDMLAGTSSASCTQALQGAIPDFQLSVTRSVIQSVIYIIGGKLVGSDFRIKREMISGLLYLGFVYLLFNVGYFGATAYLPLAEGYGVRVIASIVTAFLHSRLVFHIDITKSEFISLFVCTVGIILAVQPSWLFDQSARSSEVKLSASENVSDATHPMNISSPYKTDVSKGEVLLGYILSVIGGIGMGLMYDINGIILEDVKPIVKVTYATTFCMIWSVVFMFYMEEPVLMMDLTQFMLVLGHGVLSTIASFLFILAAHYIPGPTLSAVHSFQMVMMMISQYTIMYSIQPGNYNWIEVLGCVIIVFGGSISSIMDILVHRAEGNEAP